MMKKTIFFLMILPFLLFSASCLRNPVPGKESGILPNITGASGEVLIVLENSLWNGEAGNILRESLEQLYPALPQPEPLFDVIHITTGAFDNVFKLHRSILLIDISDKNARPGVTYSENNWARPQFIINVTAPENESLIKVLQENKDRIVYNLITYDRKRIANVYQETKDVSIKNLLAKFHVNMAIPRGYTLDINSDDFVSVSIETTQTSQVLFIYKSRYYGPKNLTTESLIERRNEFLKRYTRGTRDDSYMTTSASLTPIAFDLTKDNRKFIEIRGLWELYNGYMGGPFISHTTLNENLKEIVTVEGYVYNPNGRKRNMMRQLEAIVYSMEIIE